MLSCEINDCKCIYYITKLGKYIYYYIPNQYKKGEKSIFAFI